MGKVKIVDVAREAGVSLGTVSNALNHPDRVRPETRKAIDEAIRRLGYTPNQSARLLAGGRNAMIGLVLPRLNHGFCLQIISGAEHEAKRHGYGLLTSSYDDDATLETRYVGYFMGTQMAGVLVLPSEPPRADAAPPATPTVYLDTVGEAAGRYVTADCRAQGRLIAEHALACGARHIAVIGCDSAPYLDRRLKGVRDALGTYPDVELEIVNAGEWNEAGDGFGLGLELARRAADARPDFVIGLTDVLAAGALEGVQAAGLIVPDDMRIAGCDGNILAWTNSIALTTCAPAGYEMGRKGVQLLIEQIGDATSGASRHIDVRRPLATPRRANEADEPRIEVVRPFLLTRESTQGAAPEESVGQRATRAPGANLGTYL